MKDIINHNKSMLKEVKISNKLQNYLLLIAKNYPGSWVGMGQFVGLSNITGQCTFEKLCRIDCRDLLCQYLLTYLGAPSKSRGL